VSLFKDKMRERNSAPNVLLFFFYKLACVWAIKDSHDNHFI